MDSGKAFSILGGLSFLTFLGVLLYQLANQSSASGRVMDMDAPLLWSDFKTDYSLNNQKDLSLLSTDLNALPPSMLVGNEDNSYDSVDRVAEIFNHVWRAHRRGNKSYRCVQRKLCETLSDVRNQHHLNEPVIQMAIIIMSDWLSESDSAQWVDRVIGAISTSKSGVFDCSTLVPRCRSSPTRKLRELFMNKGLN